MPNLKLSDAKFLEDTFARNRALYGGFTMELPNEAPDGDETPPAQTPVEAGAEGTIQFTQEEMAEVVNRIQSLENRNAELENQVKGLTSRADSQLERMKAIAMGRASVTPAEIEQEQRQLGRQAPAALPDDYYTADIDF